MEQATLENRRIRLADLTPGTYFTERNKLYYVVGWMHDDDDGTDPNMIIIENCRTNKTRIINTSDFKRMEVKIVTPC